MQQARNDGGVQGVFSRTDALLDDPCAKQQREQRKLGEWWQKRGGGIGLDRAKCGKGSGIECDQHQRHRHNRQTVQAVACVTSVLAHRHGQRTKQGG